MRSVQHFSRLSEAELLAILQAGVICSYHPGEVIFLEEAPTAGLYVLLRGQIQLCKLSPEGKIAILAMLDPVIMFNEVSALDSGANPATAIAAEESLTWNAGGDTLRNLVVKYPQLGLGLLSVLASRNRRLVAHFHDLSFRSVSARVAKLLLELSANGQRPIERRKLPNHLLAARVATVPEAFSRSLKEFRSLGIIRCNLLQIEILKPAELSQLAGLTDLLLKG